MSPARATDPFGMRALRISAAVALIALALSACQIRVEQRYEVNEDGSGTVRVVTLFDEEAQEFVTFGMGFEAVTQDAPPGFEVEVVEDGDMAGTAMSASFSELSEVPELTRQLSEEGGMGTVNVRQTGDTFVFQMTLPDDGFSMDGAEMGDFGDLSDFEGFSEIEDAIQYRVVAVLPGHIVDSNADSVSGDTAEWTISMLSPPAEILFASSQPASAQAFPLGWVVAGLIGVLIVGLAIAFGRRRSSAASGDVIGSMSDVPAPTAGPVES